MEVVIADDIYFVKQIWMLDIFQFMNVRIFYNESFQKNPHPLYTEK
jgi:hypothetical protein